jgi:hypothetical protein
MTELKAGFAVFNERYNRKKISAEYAALVAGCILELRSLLKE